MNDTVVPLMEQTDVAVASMANVTGLPEAPPVAVTFTWHHPLRRSPERCW